MHHALSEDIFWLFAAPGKRIKHGQSRSSLGAHARRSDKAGLPGGDWPPENFWRELKQG